MLDAAAEAFNLPPKVDSAVVRMIPLPASMIKVKTRPAGAGGGARRFREAAQDAGNNLRGLLEPADSRGRWASTRACGRKT